MADRYSGKFGDIFKRLNILENHLFKVNETIDHVNNVDDRLNETIDHVNNVDDRLNETIDHVNNVDDRLNETIDHVNNVDDRLNETIDHINEVDDRDRMQIENNTQLLNQSVQRLNSVDSTLAQHYQNFINTNLHIVSLTNQVKELKIENNNFRLENNSVKERLDKLDRNHQSKLISVENRLKDLINTVNILNKDYEDTKSLHAQQIARSIEIGNKQIGKLQNRFDYETKLNFDNFTKLSLELTTISKLWENQFHCLNKSIMENRDEINSFKSLVDTNKQEISLIRENNVKNKELLELKSVEIAKLTEREYEIECGLVNIDNGLKMQAQQLINFKNKCDHKFEIISNQLKANESNYTQLEYELGQLKTQLIINIKDLGSQVNDEIRMSNDLINRVNLEIGKLKEKVNQESSNSALSAVVQVGMKCDIQQLRNKNATLLEELESHNEITDKNMETLRKICAQMKHTVADNKAKVLTITDNLAAAEVEFKERQQRLQLELAEVDNRLGPFNLRNIIKVELENFLESERRPKGRRLSEFFKNQAPLKHFRYSKKYKHNTAGNNNSLIMEHWLDVLNFKNILKERITYTQLLGLINHVPYQENLIKKDKIRKKKSIKRNVISLNKASGEIKLKLRNTNLQIQKQIKNNNQNQYVSGIAYVNQHRKVPKLKKNKDRGLISMLKE